MPETQYNLSIHHIGGRAGTREFPVMEAFEANIENVLYEADDSCIDEIKRAAGHLPSKTVVMPFCIGGSNGAANFYIYQNRYGSSMFKIAPEYSETYSYNLVFAWDNEPSSYLVDESPMLNVTTMDSIYTGKNTEASPPDFLSIDTEGAEFDILHGSRTLLAHHIIAVKAEVSFIPIRSSHKLFHEVQQFLSDNQFSLADLTVFKAEARYSRPLPIGLRGEGISGSGDALFFKTPAYPIQRQLHRCGIGLSYLWAERTGGYPSNETAPADHWLVEPAGISCNRRNRRLYHR